MKTSRCWADLLEAGRIKIMKMAKLSARATENVIMRALTVSGSSLRHFDRMVEQVEAKRDTGLLQSFAELGHDAGGIKATSDVSARPQPELLKDVNVLKTH